MLKRLENPPPRRGLTMNMWAVAGEASIGMRCAPISSFFKALANDMGFPQIFAPVASASYSRDREMAN